MLKEEPAAEQVIFSPIRKPKEEITRRPFITQPRLVGWSAWDGVDEDLKIELEFSQPRSVSQPLFSRKYKISLLWLQCSLSSTSNYLSESKTSTNQPTRTHLISIYLKKSAQQRAHQSRQQGPSITIQAAIPVQYHQEC